MLYFILLAYLVVAFFYPVVGLIALICMIAPPLVALRKGRFWCGNYCPRGNLFDKLISKVSRKKRIPTWMRTTFFRVVMLLFIFTMFGVQMSSAWGDLAAIGRVFWVIIAVTTVVGVALAVIYAPRTWCSFCPMGTLSAWASPKVSKPTLPVVTISDSCVLCKRCEKVCPMQLPVQEAKGSEVGYLHSDCLKCGLCVKSCPKKAMTLRNH
ncbi:MAG: 4Fe-4S binding protein [Phocaeicola sp.]